MSKEVDYVFVVSLYPPLFTFFKAPGIHVLQRARLTQAHGSQASMVEGKKEEVVLLARQDRYPAPTHPDVRMCPHTFRGTMPL